MNQRECNRLIGEYVSWLRGGLEAEVVGGACELTTPFLDRHNDHLQVYAERVGDQIVLSDDGYILGDLEASGLEINTPKRRQALQTMLNGVGVQERDGRLYIEASERTLGQRTHALVQAMISVNDMFVMAQSRVASFFWEDVRGFLDAHDVRFSPRVKLAGRSGFDHGIDFLIPASRGRPERIVQAINQPSKNTITAYLFTLNDTRQAREQESRAYAFLNDAERAVPGDVVEALEAYEVVPAPWSDRERFAEELAA